MNKKRRRRVGLLLIFIMICTGIFPDTGAVSVQAATTAKAAKQMYALEITTGSSGVDMDSISTILISYKEKENGRNRVHAIYPKEDTDHTAAFLQDGDEAELEKKVLAECEEKTNDGAAKYQFLPYSTRTFLFVPYDEIGEVTSVRIILSGNSGKWSIQGMRLIKVDGSVTPKSSGNAVVSSVKRVCYSGKQIMQMQGKTYEMGWGDADVLRQITNNSDKSTYLKNIKETDADANYETYNADRDDYIVRLNIADEYMAGLESLVTESGQNADIHKMKPADLLYVTVCYEDIYGNIQKANIPVISNVLAEAYGTSGRINGLAQQGEEIAFTAHLYGFKKLVTGSSSNHGITVTLGMDQVEKNCYITQTGKSTAQYTSKGRAAAAKTANDSISLTDIFLYKKANATLKAEITSNELAFSFSDGTWEKTSPAYYFSYAKNSGRKIEYGQIQGFDLKDNTEEKSTVKTAQRDLSGLYLVELDTADIANAATTGDLDISLTYKTIGGSTYIGTKKDSTSISDVSTGMQNTTNVYSVREKVTEYYGYWQAQGADPEAYAYHRGTLRGGKLYFLLSLSDVDTFVSATVSLNGTDEWQTSGIKISRVTSMKKRLFAITEDLPNELIWGSHTTTTDREITRQVEGQEIASSSEQVLIRENKKKTIYFDETKSATETDQTEEWDLYADSMSYETACTNLGFGKNGVSYDVDVTVAGSAEANSNDGDCGSKNLFYFRLNFENGSSAYVLANQQLSADGFRTGQTERFSVLMNRDYGELTSVDIIPDDTSSSSDIYDKLNIAKIRVNRKGGNSLNRAWEILNPGWVGIDYVEDGKKEAEAGSSDNSGRYEGEIVRSFPVDHTTYSVRLLFAISTAEYKEKENQFSGSVRADLSYIDTNNEPQTVSFDMVRQMYEYDQTSGSEINMETIDGKSYYIADNSLMFRGNSVDRFFLDLSDVKSLESMELWAKDQNGSTWRINDVGVSLVSETGQMILNSNNEYVYTGKTKELTSQTSEMSPAYSLSVTGKDLASVTVEFNPNEIAIDDSSSSSASAKVTRKPSGNNDTLNFYIIPDEAGRQRMDAYNMKLDFSYVNAYGGQYVNGINSMRKNGRSFYVEGISTRNFNLLDRVLYRATTSDLDQSHILGDEMVVQQVRSQVLLNTYRADMSGIYLDNPDGTLSFEQYTNQQTQTVSLYFGNETQEQKLSEGKKDVAVSIGFQTSVGGETQNYRSPYVFLTDEQYEEIHAGMIANVDFHIPYLANITEVRVASVGELNAQVEKIIVATYEGDDSADLIAPENNASKAEWSDYRKEQKEAQEGRTCSGWYSINESKPLKNEVTVFNSINADPYATGTLVPVNVTLTADENTVDPNTDLALVVKYRRKNIDQEYEAVVESVRSRMGTDSSFEAEKSVTVQMMLSDVEEITGLDIKTTKDGMFYPLKSAEITWNNCGKTQTLKRDAGESISSQYYKISFVNAVLNLTAESEPQDHTKNGVSMSSTDSDQINLWLEKGDKLKVDVDYQSSRTEDTWLYDLYRLTDSGARAAVEETGIVTKTDKKIVIHTSKLEGGNYLLVIRGKDSNLSYDVLFTVEDKQTSKEQADTQNTESKKEDTKEDTKEGTKKEEKKEDSSQDVEE